MNQDRYFTNIQEKQRYGLAIVMLLVFKMQYLLLPMFNNAITDNDDLSNVNNKDGISSINSSDSSTLNIPMNRHVKDWIVKFKKNPDNVAELYRKGSLYRPFVEKILYDNDLPLVLFYLPMIESRYEKDLRSHAAAVGPWQFTRLTAKFYGLKMNRNVDERKHIILSTKAAANYLKDLYNQFNSWELALAAYNCGPTCVAKSIKKGKTNNYWTLVDKKLLPVETRNYVAKFMALTYIAEGNSPTIADIQ